MRAPDNRWLVLLSVGAGTFMSALDGSIVNTVLPVVTRDFGAEVATVEWVVTTYLLVVSGLLLGFGRLGDLHGHKRVYLVGFVVFLAGSALCGLAPSVGVLIASRGLQAFGAAMLFANSPAILTRNFSAAQRGQALGLLATMTYLGLTVGPSLGGWLADLLTWRAVFFVNLPVGLLALGMSRRFIPDDRPEPKGERFDLAGAAMFLGGLVLLLLGVNRAHDWGWASPATLGALAVSGIVLVAFVASQRRTAHPMLDLALFRNRTFTASVAGAVLIFVCLFTVLFLLPFYLIHGRGLTPSRAGLVLTAHPLVMAIAAPISGTLSDRIGTRLLAALGMAVLAAGLLLLSRLGPDSSLLEVVGALSVVGLGTGIFGSPNNSALLGAAPRRRQGIAAATLATARNVGMALGVALGGAIFSTILARHGVASGPAALFEAIHVAFLVACGIAVVGFASTWVRGDG